ncbi:MAG: sirohydrochlorin chelatase [Pseudonocardiales bacterium]|nr:sirohydrochlorin chelatase [Pseudonocardiales bacterium]
MVRALLDGIRAAAPDVTVVEAWVEAREPQVSEALASVSGPAVVVPLLLSVGYHLRVDIPEAIGARPATVLTGALGPDPRAVAAMADRLRAARAGHEPAEHTILVAAGSSDPDALDDLAAAVALLEAELGRPVLGAVMTAAEPLLADVLGRTPGSIEIANYLLADGYFAQKMVRQATEHGVRIIGAPLGPHPELVALALGRYGEGEAEVRALAGM